MARLDVAKRLEFANAYAELGNATQAAIRAGVPQSSAHSMGYRWLRDERVASMVRDAIDDRLKTLGPLAVGVLEELMVSNHVSPQTRLQAARDVLDRLGWVPPRRAERLPDEPEALEEMSLAQLHRLVSGQPGVKLDETSLVMVAEQDP